MHDIEPHYRWREKYIASEDERSPFYGRTYDEFTFSQQIYNYYIHPQWDFFGSPTLYLKVLFVDYEHGFAVIELLGEWNDCVQNDIMFLKRDVIDPMLREDIRKFIFIGENVLNFHGDDELDYYEEWQEDIGDRNGWIALLNLQPHVLSEMQESRIHYYIHFHDPLDDVNWRSLKPHGLCLLMDKYINEEVRGLESGAG